ncbi:TIGR00730 family Rossman fold protein [Bradyrhizobium genosp. P]|uniref:LOG family protein n=1 Tax=Bradyrhizobium genosp. P TaxID=83641 RepID=UPI003CE7D66D
MDQIKTTPIKTNPIKTVCVYCGSGPGNNPRFVEAAMALGKTFAENNIRLVYGGGSYGLMGAVAKSALDHGGIVTGIIPEFLMSHENALKRVQEMIVTPDMHERKRLMFERSDAFVALPGGIGTLEELIEQLTWQQLGRHAKPILLTNIDGFWEPLLALLAHMRSNGFIRPNLEVDVLKAERVEDILPRLRAAAANIPAGRGTIAPELARKL